MDQGGLKKCLPVLSVAPFCWALVLLVYSGLYVLTVDLVFESIDLQRSCRNRVATYLSGLWFRADCMDISVYLKEDKHGLLCILIILPFYTLCVCVKREICFRNKATYYLYHLFFVCFWVRKKKSTRCPVFELVLVWSFGTLNFPVVIWLSLSMSHVWVWFEHLHRGESIDFQFISGVWGSTMDLG